MRRNSPWFSLAMSAATLAPAAAVSWTRLSFPSLTPSGKPARADEALVTLGAGEREVAAESIKTTANAALAVGATFSGKAVSSRLSGHCPSPTRQIEAGNHEARKTSGLGALVS